MYSDLSKLQSFKGNSDIIFLFTAFTYSCTFKCMYIKMLILEIKKIRLCLEVTEITNEMNM